MDTFAYKCERCGAPLEVSPETILAVCPYCGYPNHISGLIHTENVYIVPSLDRDKIINSFWQRCENDFDLKRIKNEIQIEEVKGFYVPYWIGDVHVKGEVKYQVEERRGDRTVIVTKHEYINNILKLMGVGRRQITEFGVDDIIFHVRQNTPHETYTLKDISEEDWEKTKQEFLNTELDEIEAKKIMMDDAVDIVREYYRKKSKKIVYFRCEASEPKNLSLVFLPVWIIYYRYKNGIFKTVITGWDGVVVATTEPLILHRQLLSFFLIVLGLLLLWFGGWTFIEGYKIFDKLMILGFFAIIGGFTLVIKMSPEVIKGVREERL